MIYNSRYRGQSQLGFLLLVFVESYIHQPNEFNGDQLCPTMSSNTSNRRPPCGSVEDLLAGSWVVLSYRGLLTKRIGEDLSEGLKCWKLEQTWCTTIFDGIHVKVEDVVQAIRLNLIRSENLGLLERSLTSDMGQAFLEVCIFLCPM